MRGGGTVKFGPRLVLVDLFYLTSGLAHKCSAGRGQHKNSKDMMSNSPLLHRDLYVVSLEIRDQAMLSQPVRPGAAGLFPARTDACANTTSRLIITSVYFLVS